MINDDELLRLIKKSKTDEDAINQLIKKYKPFIASEISKFEKRFINDDDELLTLGMLAFFEATKSFDEDKGAFISYARKMIKFRLIDYHRKIKNNSRTFFLKDNELELNNISISSYYTQIKVKERKDSIEEYKKELNKWNIDFIKLVEVSPKSKKLKELYKDMGKYIFNNLEISQYMKNTKKLPIAKLEKEFKVNRKKIERGRIFIISCFIMMDEKYLSLNEYIK